MKQFPIYLLIETVFLLTFFKIYGTIFFVVFMYSEITTCIIILITMLQRNNTNCINNLF